MNPISSSDNPKLRWLRRLAESRGRRRTAEQIAERMGRVLGGDQELLLLEGPHLVAAALGADLDILQVFASSDASTAVAALQARLDAVENPPQRFEVTDGLLHGAVEAETSQGICALAILTHRPLPTADDLDGRVLAVWLDQLRDPGNVGAVLRVAEAAGVRIAGVSKASASWRHPRALRASAGSALRLHLRTDLDFDSFCDEVDQGLAHRLRWVGLDAQGGPLLRTDENGLVGIALGSESHGLSPDVVRRCDTLCAIEMAAPVESLNVAVAAGIALYSLRGDRHCA